MDFLQKRYRERGPASLRTAVLLDKPAHRTIDVPIDYRGFEIADRFVVGYGMDSEEKFVTCHISLWSRRRTGQQPDPPFLLPARSSEVV
jgi:hypothetical protein